MLNFPLPRIDTDKKLQKLLLPYCRFKIGDIWIDPIGKHKIACIDSSDLKSISQLMDGKKAALAVHDPPYNFVAFEERETQKFILWSQRWIENSYRSLKENSSLYVWLGADQKNNFKPLAEFFLMMQQSGFASRSLITMRNQRGYGTQKNWMAIRQELLYYVKGKPNFNIEAEYTEIPKVLRGYYKIVGGISTDNFERSKSKNIRAGNVWIDVQQVFYRLQENVNGCYAQKPLKAMERIINASSKKNEIVIDFFSHSGTSLIASEILARRCFTSDIDPVFCEISLRRLENYRLNKKTGWQNSNPFAEEIAADKKLKNYLKEKYDIKPKLD